MPVLVALAAGVVLVDPVPAHAGTIKQVRIAEEGYAHHETNSVLVIDALGNMGAAGSVPTLTERYSKEDPQGRWHTLKALDYKRRPPRHVPRTPGALHRVASALSGHYVVAFERPEGRRGEHRVRLALDGRRGTVLTRSRYAD